MPSVREKACKYYREQNLRFITVTTPDGGTRPTYVEAKVRGHQTTHYVLLDAGVWTCSCDAAARDCAHRATVKMATGYASAAAKEPS